MTRCLPLIGSTRLKYVILVSRYRPSRISSGDPFGEPVEVGVGFEEAGHVAAGPFALEVVIDRPADECGGFATGVLAMGFQSVSYLDYAGVRRCWMGSGLLAGCSV